MRESPPVSPRTFVVELLGLPGSGKTTAAMGGHAAGDWFLLERPPMVGGLAARINLLMRAPIVGLLAYGSVLARRNVKLSNLKRVTQIQRGHLASKEAVGLSLLDEGGVHGIFMTNFGTAPTRLSSYLLRRLIRRLISAVDVYVLINTPPATIIERLRQRDNGASRFGNSTDELHLAALCSDHTYEELIECITRIAPSKICVTSSTEGAVHELAGYRRMWLTELA